MAAGRFFHIINTARYHALSLFLCVLIVGCGSVKVVRDRDPLTARQHLMLGYVYETKGEYEDAVLHYRTASEELPEAILSLGNVYFKMGDYSEAERYYKRAMSDPEVAPDAMNNLAWLYYTQQTRLEEAEELVLRAIQLKPERREIYEDTLTKIRRLLQAQRESF